jgi:hypothetical protein
MGMAVAPFLVIVDQVDVVCVAALKAEGDAPVGGNPDAPKPLPITLQRVESVAWGMKVLGLPGIIKVSQGDRDTLRLIGSHPARVPLLIKPLETAMAKRPDHT